MEYRVIRKDFGSQPLAGYMMDVIDLTRDKDGLDAMAFLKNIDEFCNIISEVSLDHNGDKREFFFAINTEEDIFPMDFYIAYTVKKIKEKDYIDGWEYEDTRYFRMYTEDEDWGLDEICLCDETEIKVAEINVAKKPIVEVKEESNMEIGYVLKEKLSCGCWDGCFGYFYQELCTEPTERLRILTAINEFMYQGDESVKKFICLDTEIDNVDSLDEVHMMNDVIDSMNYKKAYVAMLDENGNPSLFDIELRPSINKVNIKINSLESKVVVSLKTGKGYTLYRTEKAMFLAYMDDEMIDFWASSGTIDQSEINEALDRIEEYEKEV